MQADTEGKRSDLQSKDISSLEKKVKEYQKFKSIFKEFMGDAEEKFSETSQRVTSIQKEIADLIILFGEDDSMKSTEFFEMFYNFASDFCRCYKNILLTEKVKAEQEEKRQRQLQSAEKNSQGGSLPR